MSAPALKRLDLSAFFALAEAREGKWELFDGVPIAMSPERLRRGTAEFEAGIALRDAIRREGLGCQASVDTLTIKINDYLAFVPDALVVCPPPPPDAIVIDNPLILVEVLSPSTAAVDQGSSWRVTFLCPPWRII